MKHLTLRVTVAISMMCAVVITSAQTTREELKATVEKNAGVYYAYPVKESKNTPAPKGYKPFYISHMGRHGSRYLLSESDYTKPINTLQAAANAGALTPLGLKTLEDLRTIYQEADGRAGDLSPLGVKQHKAIAARMFDAYPEVFTDNAEITAHSTMVMRCAMSMASFCESLKERNSKLNITKEPSNKHVRYLSHQSPAMVQYNGANGPWREEYRKFRNEHTNPDRLINSLFNDTTYVRRNINTSDLMWQLYWIAIDLQNVETPIELYSLFTSDELFDLWQCFNYNMYAQVGNNALSNGAVIGSSKPLVMDIINRADEKVKLGKNGADLRFGHDINIIPLAGLLGFEGCTESVGTPTGLYEHFADFKVSPMGANIQMILFKDKRGDVIAKFMHNEREVHIPLATDKFPFYNWEEVKAYYKGLCR